MVDDGVCQARYLNNNQNEDRPMTFDYKIIPVFREAVDSSYRIDGFSEKRMMVSRKSRKERRKQPKDRRSSIRDGIIVSLSSKNNRRKGIDRRHLLNEIFV